MSQASNQISLFIKEVAKYYMDFLETDFHKRRSPKRHIQYRSADNLLIGINLNKYPDFNKNFLKTVNKGFSKDSLNVIEKGKYTTTISSDLLEIVQTQARKITQEDINVFLSEISDIINHSVQSNKIEYERVLNYCTERITKRTGKRFVEPIVSSIAKSLFTRGLADENTLYIIHEELTSILVALIDKKISEVIRRLITKDSVNISDELFEHFSLEQIVNDIIAFFGDFNITDLFAEISEMERNKNILDKQEFYFYFFDITYKKKKYPIFYIPVSLERNGDNLFLEYDSQVYVNKKALEYIVQEYNKEKDTKGSLNTISERIIYLAHHKSDFHQLINNILIEICEFFNLDSRISLNNSDQQLAKSLWVRVSNTCFFSLFEKSDEALVNDYEEIISKLNEGDDVIAEAFHKLVDDFINKNPHPFNPDIEDEWDNYSTTDRLVFRSPIPLNSEQLQILSAVDQPECKYITVEGPPGTGKSHTITAIIFNSILKKKSVLVLSDKKEALDVVEEKITDSMNQVRHDKSFQNPILRLGKTGSTYSQILATASISDIKNHYRAVKKDYSSLKQEIEETEESMKEELETELISLEEINIDEVYELIDLENTININELLDIEEVQIETDFAFELDELRTSCIRIKEQIGESNSPILSTFNEIDLDKEYWITCPNLVKVIYYLNRVKSIYSAIVETYGEKTSVLNSFPILSNSDFNKLDYFINEFESIKNPLWGYLFNRKKMKELDSQFYFEYPNINVESAHNSIDFIKNIVRILRVIRSDKEFSSIPFDSTKVITQLLFDETFKNIVSEIISLEKHLEYILDFQQRFPKTTQMLGIDISKLDTVINTNYVVTNSDGFDSIIRYISLRQKLHGEFGNIPTVFYEKEKRKLQNLITTQMTYIMDGQLLNFYENNKNDATTLRNIIRKKQRFPKDEFIKLKEAFPCILAGIRDYAEYIPLEPEIFDLVIIDEASQVSIAQAFPALLRAKKVLILGDKKQFSNVKSAQARTDTNKQYLNNIHDVFVTNVSADSAKIIKLDKFNIKTSILEFFEFITNFQSQLIKHFRGYKESISYSNNYFYLNNLQVMKVRAKPVDEVIKFSFIEHDGKQEVLHNTNTLEAEFIIRELQKLKENGINQSVCIITPHTNQQKLILDMISKLPEKDYYFDKFKLKIFTFDTCQGEERDIVYYSMVATKDVDRLWGVFIKDLSKVDIEEEGQIKAQRLNVGLSRSKETMHFVCSKSLDDYTGSIGEALRNYQNVLHEARSEPSVNEVDQNSPMERNVLNWIMQTDFWRTNFPKKVFIKPQFQLGKYLKQLDKMYNHPNYKVDFLLIYVNDGDEKRIIIEYDGFEEHFTNREQVNELNYEQYYTDEDIYRQKVLESYGYTFLRLNRFNTGKNPIETLDKKIKEIINHREKQSRLDRIHKTVKGLQTGDIKECPKCKEIKPIKDFINESTKSGFSRLCSSCRKTSSTKSSKSNKKQYICSRCGARMVVRNGRYGKFYGCSRFPYCRNTKNYGN